MSDSSFNHVRDQRLRHALTTPELGELLGHASGGHLRRVERGERLPSLETAIGLQVVFGLAPRDLFPGLYDAVEEAVMPRAHEMLMALDGRADGTSAAKRALLEDMPGRSRANDIEA